MAKLDLNVLTNEPEDIHQVIQFKGEMDKSNNVQVREALGRFIEQFSLKVLFFDLTYFDFVNSEGVGMMVSMYYKAKQLDKEMIILSPQPQVKDVFDTIGLSKIVPIFANMDLALESLK